MGEWMEECEICGARMGDVYVVNVEDVELRVCTKCAKGKKIVYRIEKGRLPGRRMPKTAAVKAEDPQLVENYGSIIHAAREAMRLPLKVLAEMLNEKETLLHRIEQQRTMPSIGLTKKLERALSVRLVEQSAAAPEDRAGSSSRGERATIGDYIA